jgi:hypothetical protein
MLPDGSKTLSVESGIGKSFGASGIRESMIALNKALREVCFACSAAFFAAAFLAAAFFAAAFFAAAFLAAAFFAAAFFAAAFLAAAFLAAAFFSALVLAGAILTTDLVILVAGIFDADGLADAPDSALSSTAPQVSAMSENLLTLLIKKPLNQARIKFLLSLV